MAMLIRIETVRDPSGSSRAGWLVLEYGPNPNVFHVDDQTLTVSEVQHKYGGIVMATIRVGPTEFKRLKSQTITR